MVSIITINYNNAKVTADLLISIQSLDRQGLEVIVVDNGSKQNPETFLTTWFPWIKFIRSERNLGFAGGNNLGIKHASGDYLFFINNDTEFKANIIPRLVSLLEVNPHIGILCPVIRYFDSPSAVQYAGYTQINQVTGRNHCITTVQPVSGYGLVTTSYAHGAAMMIPKLVIQHVGLMPENYFLYYEELDWCESIKKAGYTIAVDPLSLFYHKESRTVGAISELKSYFMSRNRILFMRRNAILSARFLFWFYFILVATPVQVIKYLIRHQWKNVKAHFAGIKWNLLFAKDCKTIGYKFNYLNTHD
jgi:GT2 family glycosyltransferase